MIYLNNLKEIDLEKMLNTEEYNIIFGGMIPIKESIPIRDKSNKKLFVYIRNKKLDGANDKKIPHECTVKLIRGDIYGGKDNKGLPFSIEPKLKLYEKVDNDKNRKLIKNNKNDYKFLEKVVNDNKEDILAYWEADPDTIEGRNTIKIIEDKIYNKYKR